MEFCFLELTDKIQYPEPHLLLRAPSLLTYKTQPSSSPLLPFCFSRALGGLRAHPQAPFYAHPSLTYLSSDQHVAVSSNVQTQLKQPLVVLRRACQLLFGT